MSNRGIENLIVLGILTLFGGLVYSRAKKKFEITHESDSNALLKRFNKLIDITPDKVVNLKRAHETIRHKIKSYFINNTYAQAV